MPTSTVEITIRTNFSRLLDLLAEKLGVERISNNYISRSMPMDYKQVRRWRDDKLTRFDLITLQKSLNFFNSHGLKIGIQDLFCMDSDDEK